MNREYYSKSIDEIFTNLKTSEDGLSKYEVKRRIEIYGKNSIPTKDRKSIISIIINEIINPIIILLLFAALFSFLTSEIVDGFFIIGIILVDLVIGAYEENKANQTIDSLNKLVPERVKVIRDGSEELINSSELVIGDIVLLESGDKISADLRIINSHNLVVDESILTGESLGVLKDNKILKKKDISIIDQSNMLFAGCSVITGRCVAIVVRTGPDTEIGKIADTIHNSEEEKSPLVIRMNEFSKIISLCILTLSFILAIILYSKGVALEDILLSVIALAVSSMPEGLPLALTMALTIAANKMAKKKVVTKKLYSAEALGSCTVIASDKTGTLTVNEQTAKRIVLPNNLEYEITGTGYMIEGSCIGIDIDKAKEIATLGVINNEAVFTKDDMMGDSIDLAFLVLGEKLKIKTNDIEIIDSIPYESSNKYSAVFYKKNNKVYCTVKGSLEVIKDFCSTINFKNKKDFSNIFRQNEELASDGYRVIALALGEVDLKEKYSEKDINDLKFMGLVGFIDPIRKEVVKAIKDCRNASINVLMITGDHPLTAFKIAKDLKLTNDYSDVASGDDIKNALGKSRREFDEFVKSKCVFARISAEEKLLIIESLKRQGEFVAVSGDGVNDALALQRANVGISMGSGTDIAKETSNMIVLDDNFKSIVSAVYEGRVAYSNIRKIVYFLISCGFAEVLFFLLSVLFNLEMPLLAIQLLWLNVVTDGIQDIALSFCKGDKDIMRRPPRSPNSGLFDRTMIEEILISGLTIGIVVFLFWVYLVSYLKLDIVTSRSYVMALMIIIQNVHAFNCISEEKSILEINIFSNKIFIVGIIGSMLLGVSVIEIEFLSNILKTTQIPLNSFGLLFLLAFIVLLVMELFKKIKSNRKNVL